MRLLLGTLAETVMVTGTTADAVESAACAGRELASIPPMNSELKRSFIPFVFIAISIFLSAGFSGWLVRLSGVVYGVSAHSMNCNRKNDSIERALTFLNSPKQRMAP